MMTASCALQAQSLSGEVTLERTITPAERPANRLGTVSPAIQTPQVKLRALQPANYNGTGQLSRSLTRLEPASYADTFAIDPWKGYVSAGYLPGRNFGIEAGYDLISTRTTRLGTFLSFSGEQREEDSDWVPGIDDKLKTGHQEYTVGASLSTVVGNGRRIDGTAAYTFSNMIMPLGPQNVKGGANHARIALGYDSSTGSMPWRAGVSYGYFGFRHDTPAEVVYSRTNPALINNPSDMVAPASESLVKLDGGLSYAKDSHRWDLGIGIDLQHLNRLARIWPSSVVLETENPDSEGGMWRAVPTYWNEGSHTLSVISLTPSYNLGRDKVSLRLGAHVQYTTGPRGNKFRVSPDVNLAWTPSARFALDVDLTGGERINSLASLYAESPWMIPAFSYERSNLPFVIDASVSFIPFRGFTVRAFGGFALADSWLMPEAVGYNERPQYGYQDLHGAHYGVELGYSHRIFSLKASIEGATSSDDDAESGYYLWTDRASFEFKASAEVRPVKPLSIELGYRFRGDRKVFFMEPQCFGAIAWLAPDGTHDLGDISDLSLNATWRFNDRLSVFANLDNLLCKRYQLIYEVPSARLGGLVGVTFKF